jgi:hypothetical protein
MATFQAFSNNIPDLANLWPNAAGHLQLSSSVNLQATGFANTDLVVF